MKIRMPMKAQAEAVERPEPNRLPPGVASVLSVLASSAVVLDSEDRVLQASVAARAYGLVKSDELVGQELLALGRQVRREGEIRAGEMEVSTDDVSGRTTSCQARAPALGAGCGQEGRLA